MCRENLALPKELINVTENFYQIPAQIYVFLDHYLIGVTNAGLTSSKRQLFVVDMESGESQISEPVIPLSKLYQDSHYAFSIVVGFKQSSRFSRRRRRNGVRGRNWTKPNSKIAFVKRNGARNVEEQKFGRKKQFIINYSPLISRFFVFSFKFRLCLSRFI